MLSFIVRVTISVRLYASELASRRPGRHLQISKLRPPSARTRLERGQATAEYALVLLGAAAIALMLTAWAAKSGAISRLFDAVVDQLVSKVG